ncbi:MAG: tRNA (5-methylaminomethyl-2-thiouridine)(34)-methyltransferase MnmD [Flavobacteriales bacterium]|nr:tRNA (5-methylaminomethyl-2-thiouridine)(34)-methyltransferase MnmD [Flavobacteriales bacterium]
MAIQEIVPTADGSFTLKAAHLDETYHSRHGALSESAHVFIENGLKYFLEKNTPSRLNILEIGFGTGLNALLAEKFLQENFNGTWQYVGFEPFPPDFRALFHQGFYPSSLHGPILEALCQGQKKIEIFGKNSGILILDNSLWPSESAQERFDVIFYDAFAPSKQPEMWTILSLEKAFSSLNKGGVWVSYAAQGAMRRNLKQAGFHVEKLPGPPGKREMTRALKL